MALGVAFITGNDALVYQMNTVPTRYNGYATLAFLTAFLCGQCLRRYCYASRASRFCSVTFASISGFGIGGVRDGRRTTGLSLSTIHSSVQQASHLAPDYGMLQVWRIVLLAATD